MDTDLLEINKKKLFTFAMRGKWEEVTDLYEKDARLHKAKVTRTGDTALHIAVSDGNEEVVAQMMEIVCSCSEQHRKEALQTQNDRNSTALHLAASVGNLRMCQLIGGTEPSLVGIRNVDGETPLFLAALHGRKHAFLCLHYLCNTDPSSPNYDNCRRNCGGTILHTAIAGDYFDLAFQIIHLYKELVNWVNEDGLSPLHLLAAKPSVFRSGSRLGRFQMIIYHFILVEKLEVAQYKQPPSPMEGKRKTSGHHFPDNYNACWELFRVIKNSLAVVYGKAICGADMTLDLEYRHQFTLHCVGSKVREEGLWLYPANYRTCCNLFKFLYLVVMVILGQGLSGLKKIHQKKEKHTWSAQIMDELISRASIYEYDDNGSKPQAIDTDADAVTEAGNVIRASHSQQQQDKEHQKDSDTRKKETPILIAAKNGVTEMVKKILESFPVAIHDMNEKKKNVVLLAVEHRQPHVYQLLLQRNVLKESIFAKLDNEGNSALHLAAKLGDYKPWLIPGAALQMQWEIKWFEFVKESMQPHFFNRYNKNNKTPRAIFTETHTELVKSGGEWLSKTSESCSVVAALIATVAFATSTTLPGGVDQKTGHPTLERQPAFNLFAISSLIALCCSITAVVMFLSILTSRYQEFDFGKDLPKKLILGLTSLFVSIVSMLVSFSAGHYFVLKDQLHYLALPIYVLTMLPVTLFALAQFPLYFDLVWATFKKVPQRSYKASPVTSESSKERKDSKGE